MPPEPGTTTRLKGLTRWIHERVPEDADLDRPALAQLVVDLSGEPRFWKRFVRHDPTTRHFVQLYRDPHLDLWLICWLDAQDTGYHDHDVSSGAVYVCDGTLHEDHFERRPDGWMHEVTREHPPAPCSTSTPRTSTVSDTPAARPLLLSMRIRRRSGGWGTTSSE